MKIKKFRKMAKKAGFIFWKEGEQGHNKTQIDWSCDYDREFYRLFKMFNRYLKKCESEK